MLTLFRLLPLSLLCTVLLACSGHPAEEDSSEAFRLAGYRAGPAQALRDWQATWTLEGGTLDMLLLAPEEPDAAGVPLIVYFPGQGESPQAAQAWRRGWAEAGYAVLSMQPRADIAPGGQGGGLTQAAREALLRQALLELQERFHAGAPALRGIDGARLAFAGFALGARNVVALASGEGGVPVPRATILLGPRLQADGDAQRFAQARAPLLAVTATPATPAPQPWAVAGSYLLQVDAGDELLAGNLALPRRRMAGHGPRGAGGPPGGEHAGRPGMLAGFAAAPEPAPADGDHGEAPAAAVEQARDPLQLLLVQAVSLAFLDATLQGEDAARRWLDNSAPAWLAGRARLQHKSN